MTSALFRHEAVDEQKDRLYGEVVIAQPLSFSLITFGILLSVIAIALLLIYGTYARRETVVGYIVPDKGLAKIYAPIQGVLTKQHIIEGQSVKKGQLLFSVKTISANVSGGDRDALVLVELEQSKQNLRKKIQQEAVLSDSKNTDLQQQSGGLVEELSQLDEAIRLQVKQLEMLSSKVDQYSQLADKGHVPKSQLTEAQQLKIDSQVRLQSSQRQKTQLLNRQKELAQQIKRIPLEWNSLKSDLERSLLELEQRVVEISGRREYAITAPISGRLAALQVSEGQTLNTQSPLIAILPEGTKLHAQLFLPTRAAGFIKENQSVLLKYGAFPYQHYGLHSGRVSEVAQVILSPKELPIPITLNEPVYRVKVILDNQSVSAFGKDFPLQAGMLLDADIILEKRSLGQWLLEPIYGLRGKL